MATGTPLNGSSDYHGLAVETQVAQMRTVCRIRGKLTISGRLPPAPMACDHRGVNTRRWRTVGPVLILAVVALAALGAIALLPRLAGPASDADQVLGGAAAFGDATSASSDPSSSATAGPGTPTGATSPAPPVPGGGSTAVAAAPDTTLADNTALLAANGLGSLAQHWLPVLGHCNSYAPSTPYEISSGLQVTIWCPWRGPAPSLVVDFRRFGTAAQAKDYMICQQPAGTPPPDVNESIVDLPGTSGPRAGFYCEFAAVNTPDNGIGDIGLCWTDAGQPYEASVYVPGTDMASGAATLTQLRSTWSTYA